MKEVKILFLLFLLLSNGSVVFKNVESENGRILYVGGEGEGNYTSIQEAINHAYPGDTIFVYSGIYRESITIVKPELTIIGENKTKTIITGKVSIRGNYTIIKNFTVRGFSIYSSKNIIENNIARKFVVLNGVEGIANENIIRNNSLEDVQLGDACNNVIENNEINGSIEILFDSFNNTIFNNTLNYAIYVFAPSQKIINNKFTAGGICLAYGGDKKFHKNEIRNNTINGRPIYYFYNESNIKLTGKIGEIIVVGCKNVTVKNATIGFLEEEKELSEAIISIFSNISIKNSSIYNSFVLTRISRSKGIIENCHFEDIGYGILLDYADKSIIRNNIFRKGRGKYSMAIGFHATDYAIVENNYFEGIGMGLYIGSWYSDNFFNEYNVCRNNTIKNCEWGIFIMESSNNFIVNNTIENCNIGIFLQYLANENEIRENIIRDNEKGIVIEKWMGERRFNSNNNKIFYNKFIGNSLNAFDNCGNIWYDGCVGNYWDDYTGNDADKDGIGDKPYLIPGEGNKDYAPLMEPYDSFIKIKKPSHGIYIFERKLLPVPFNFSVIIGKMVAEVSAFGVKKVEFYVNNELRQTDFSYPYEYSINEKGLFTLKVIGYGKKEIKKDETKILSIIWP